MFLSAVTAYTVNFNMNRSRLTDLSERVGQFKLIKLLCVEVLCQPAHAADKVMMPVKICIETGSVPC